MPISPIPYRWRSACLSLFIAMLTAWLWAVLLMDRALPWQATRSWALVFAAAFLMTGIWWWRLLRQISRLASDTREWLMAASWGTGPLLALTAMVLGLVYASEQFNGLVESPHWHMQLVAAISILTVAAESVQFAAIHWLQKPSAGIRSAMWDSLSRRADAIVLACLAALGVLQSAASVSPIGDDIWHYTQVAEAILEGREYPIPSSGPLGPIVGIGSTYPVLPAFPVLLALSFSLFGHNLVGVSVPLVAAALVFPLAMYAACRSVTGNRPMAYAVAVLVSLFPIYRLHVLRSGEPDTLFIVLLLLGAALAAKASHSPGRRYWIGAGAVMGLASLTRHEGTAYSAVLFLTFLVVHRLKANLWLAVASYLALLAPFAVVYRSVSGSFWPTGQGNMLSWQNLEINLANLWGTSVGWYAQALGVGREVVVGLAVALCLAAILGMLTLWKSDSALLGVPLAGMGNIAAVFFMHPALVYSAFPVDFLRHLSYGIAFACLALAHAAHKGIESISRLPRQPRAFLLVVALILASAAIYYETERLARPEPWFGGRSSLLWTGESYLLSDVFQQPVPLPVAGDPRTGEQLRVDLQRPLEGVSLRRVNSSEPYHWTSLMLALFGLLYSLNHRLSISAAYTRQDGHNVESQLRRTEASSSACKPSMVSR